MMAPPPDKAAHRAAMRALRERLPDGVRKAAARRLRDALLAHPLVAPLAPGPVLVPTRHGDEIDTAPLARLLSEAGWTLCRPRSRAAGRTLDVVPYPLDLPLIPGLAGVPEPPAEAPVLPARRLVLALVPGLAFDRDGHRVGYGAGFFDRFLPALGDVVTIGIGYRAQLVDETLPTEPHDVALDGLQLEDLSLVARARPRRSAV